MNPTFSTVLVAVLIPAFAIPLAHMIWYKKVAWRARIETYARSMTIWGILVFALGQACKHASDSAFSINLYGDLSQIGLFYAIPLGFIATSMWYVRSERVLKLERLLSRS